MASWRLKKLLQSNTWGLWEELCFQTLNLDQVSKTYRKFCEEIPFSVLAGDLGSFHQVAVLAHLCLYEGVMETSERCWELKLFTIVMALTQSMWLFACPTS